MLVIWRLISVRSTASTRNFKHCSKNRFKRTFLKFSLKLINSISRANSLLYKVRLLYTIWLNRLRTRCIVLVRNSKIKVVRLLSNCNRVLTSSALRLVIATKSGSKVSISNSKRKMVWCMIGLKSTILQSKWLRTNAHPSMKPYKERQFMKGCTSLENKNKGRVFLKMPGKNLRKKDSKFKIIPVWSGVKSPQESLLPARTMVKSFTKGE